mmetsp:Transcript_2372/g.7563  ORF Transcript_2372/g.7563 Transcript_2372/m.7563 type:complete len:404 (-) Transcript_2372:11-1222(-)
MPWKKRKGRRRAVTAQQSRAEASGGRRGRGPCFQPASGAEVGEVARGHGIDELQELEPEGSEAAEEAEPETVQPRVLEPLDADDLSVMYGKGFALLQRMGYTPGPRGLREDSLRAPLRAHDQGTSRMGVQSAEESVQSAVAEAADAVEASTNGTGRPLSELMGDVLASMREAGDHEEAEELKRLASCVGLDGDPLDGHLGIQPRKRWRAGGDTSGSSGSCGSGGGVPAWKGVRGGDGQGSATRSATEQEATDVVLDRLRGDADFPVELTEQPRQLRWAGRWKRRLGEYEAFVKRQSDAFCIIHCPAPHGKILLPRHGASPCSAGRYMSWCHRRRLEAQGRAKRKWCFVERMVARCLRSTRHGPELLATAEVVESGAVEEQELSEGHEAEVLGWRVDAGPDPPT